MAMRVLDHAVVRDRAVEAARRDDRHLALEVDERLEHRRLSPDRAQAAGASSARATFACPLPS